MIPILRNLSRPWHCSSSQLFQTSKPLGPLSLARPMRVTTTVQAHLERPVPEEQMIRALFSSRNFLENGTVALSLLFGN